MLGSLRHGLHVQRVSVLLLAAVARLHSASIDLSDNRPGLKLTLSVPTLASSAAPAG